MRAHASFPAKLEELPRIFLWIRGVLIQLHCDPSTIRKLELAVEEAAVNVIRHSQSAQIEFTIQGKPKEQVEIAILDKGSPFNPLKEVPLPDRTSPLEKRKEGGLGIFLMKQVVDEVHYKREGDANILILKKKLY